MAQVKRTAQAETDLLEIWLYVAADNIEAADRLLTMVNEKCLLLADRTQLGRERADLAPGLRSFPADSYMIYYTPESDGIIVVRVLHGSRDQEAALG